MPVFFSKKDKKFKMIIDIITYPYYTIRVLDARQAKKPSRGTKV